jgi:hypothetical protein
MTVNNEKAGNALLNLREAAGSEKSSRKYQPVVFLLSTCLVTDLDEASCSTLRCSYHACFASAYLKKLC